MIKIRGESTENRKCVVCNKKTEKYREYMYVDGTSIMVPVCHRCTDRVGMYLDDALEIHLNGIANSIKMSQIITEVISW